MRTAGPPGNPVEFELLRRRRRSVGIVVRDDGSVEVRAPLRAPLREIDAALVRHHDWIVERQRVHRERLRRRRERRFDDGDAVPFLGRSLRLTLREADPPEPPVCEGERLVVTLAPGLAVAERRAAAREAVGRWLLDRACDEFHARHLELAARVGDAAESVTIKEMRSRWGSCGPRRRMSLNWRLVLAPPHVIDYVIAHELTHIRHPDHSPRFWAAVAAACPDWRAGRDWLRDRGGDLQL